MKGFTHARGLVACTEEVMREVEELFAAHPRPRGYFDIYGQRRRIPRDALHFATPRDDGMLPCYRVYNKAYGSPRTRRGLARTEAPMAMPPWMRALLEWQALVFAWQCVARSFRPLNSQ